MNRKIKTKLLYSSSGILAGGVIIYALLQLLSLAVKQELMMPGMILRIYAAVSAVFTAALIICGVSLIRHEGFRIRNLAGIGLGLYWVAGNLLCLFVSEHLAGAGVIGRFAALLGCYADLFLSGMLIMAFIAARHKPAFDKDFVIIPGCSISKQGGLLPLLKGRTNRAIRFAWDQERASGKPARYVPTGGQGPDEIMSEGSAMEFYLLSHGAESYEVFPEKQSVNTYENMLFSKKIIDALMPDAKVCFVTTNYHVLRSGMLARKAGLDAEGLASTTKWYFWPNGLARELVAITSMYRLWQLAAFVICFAAAWVG